MIRVVESRNIQPEDLAKLAALEHAGAFRLREGDEKECLAMGMTPADAIVFSVGASINSFLVTVNGELVATWGYGAKNPLSGVGYPWLLTTTAVEKNKVFFAKMSLYAKAMLMQRFHRLDVLVDARYLRAQAWLEWLGFQAHPAAIPMNGFPFIYMQLERKDGPSNNR